MPNFIPKKDRRFPIGALFLIMYIIIGSIGAAVNALSSALIENVDPLFAVLKTVLSGGEYLFWQIMFFAIIVMLFAKVRHSTYAIPGAVGLGVHVLGFLSGVLFSIVSLIDLFELIGMVGTGSLIVSFVRSIVSNGSTLVGALFGMIGWICFILLAIFSTKSSAKKVNWTLIFAFGACLIFVSSILVNIIHSFDSLIYIVLMISDFGMRVILEELALKILVIGELFSMITAGISIVAEAFGLVGMLLAGIWLVKPAKRGYVPAAPFEEAVEPIFESDVIEAVTEEEPTEEETSTESGEEPDAKHT